MVLDISALAIYHTTPNNFLFAVTSQWLFPTFQNENVTKIGICSGVIGAEITQTAAGYQSSQYDNPITFKMLADRKQIYN